jgi:hypothetical protein
MKKSVYTYKGCGTDFDIDLEILLDLNRDLTKNDEHNLRRFVDNIVNSLHEETINLNPKSKERAEKEKSEIVSLFGNRLIYVEEIENGYDNSYYNKHLPWFIVTTNKGRIKIGWRKRVISIDWSDSIIEQDADTLFPGEDVTKYEKLIHAWSLEKAKEYIDKILS